MANAFFIFLALGATIVPLLSQDVVFKSSGAPSSLIELYSSEGCSSCPPAEEWLNHLKGDAGLWKSVFPVAFHVDYWDGLGWPDRFARAEYTQRQRDYAARLRQDSVYTPEFVLNGLEWRPSQGIPDRGPVEVGDTGGVGECEADHGILLSGCGGGRGGAFDQRLRCWGSIS